MNASSRLQHQERRAGERAFTLMESLLAVALIAVLAAVLIPVLSATRASARNVQCVANLRASGQAVIAFAAENRGQVMLAWVSTRPEDVEANPVLQGHPQAGMMWYQYLLVRRYITDPRILVCPSFPPYEYRVNPAGSEVMMTYGLRRGLAATAYLYPATLGITENPASVVILADTSKPQSWVGQSYYFTTPGNLADTIHPRHRGKANFFFLDGGVRSMTGEEVVATDVGLSSRVIDKGAYREVR